jgi:poly(3-hydroxybutyrate) depolymerase
MRIALALLLVFLARAVAAADALPAFGADPRGTSVSGVSSGGYMAVQLHVAHAGSISGVGVLAAGPYYCAQGSVWTAMYNCMTPGTWTPLPPVGQLKGAVQALAAARSIDPPAALRGSRVWLFGGTADGTVVPAVVDALERFYAQFVPPGALVRVRDVPAGHAMITMDHGAACGVTASPYINDCDFDAAGRLLAHLYGTLDAPAGQPPGRLHAFDQRPFAGGDAYGLSMADTGYVYVPAACAGTPCRVHVALHGCRQGVEAIGERFIREAGYNRWADANRLIVLYPQAIARNGPGFNAWRTTFVFNPRGCWDWWGYTGALYHTRDGAQIRAIKGMVDRIAAPR